MPGAAGICCLTDAEGDRTGDDAFEDREHSVGEVGVEPADVESVSDQFAVGVFVAADGVTDRDRRWVVGGGSDE